MTIFFTCATASDDLSRRTLLGAREARGAHRMQPDERENVAIPSSPRASAGSATAVVRQLAVVLTFGLIGWAVGTASMWLTFWFASVKTGFAVRAILAPTAFYLVSMVYFRRRGALRPLPAAFLFWCVQLVADAAVGLAFGSRMYDIPRSLLGTWLPAALVFLVTWVTGIGMEQLTPRDDATTEERTR